MTGQPPAVVQHLHRAIDGHDLRALVDLFATDYRNETPAHPARSFTGRGQVRDNWTQILAAVPDLRATLVGWGSGSPDAPSTVWAEWDWSGHRVDGNDLRMRGVTVLGIGPEDGTDVVQWARFYMEPVDEDDVDVTEAVRRIVGSSR